MECDKQPFDKNNFAQLEHRKSFGDVGESLGTHDSLVQWWNTCLCYSRCDWFKSSMSPQCLLRLKQKTRLQSSVQGEQYNLKRKQMVDLVFLYYTAPQFNWLKRQPVTLESASSILAGVARKVREAFLFVIHDNGRTVKMTADNTYNRVTLHQ